MIRRTATILLMGVGLLAASTLPMPLSAQAKPPPPSTRAAPQPVTTDDFPDPDVLLVDGVYHAYATNNGTTRVQHRTSTDLRSWKIQPDVLPTVGDWVGVCREVPGGVDDNCVWAPEVFEVEDGYALHYTARDESSNLQCIGVALAKTPDGPFLPSGDGPLVCPTEQGGAIDAATYSENGQLYLLWKSDGNCCDKPAIIYIEPLSPDGRTRTGQPVELIRNDLLGEGRVVEAPTLIKHDGTYYLLYSAGDYYGGQYRSMWASSATLLGPYEKSTAPLMTSTLWRGEVRGPGGQDVVTRRDGSTAILFHGWDPSYSFRPMYVADLVWENGAPKVVGTSDRYEAEDGALNNARVVADARASGGEKVGGMDFANSSITVTVQADRGGPATLGLWYTNGSEDQGRRVKATEKLSVNGGPVQTLTLDHTTWGNWQVLETRIHLRKGSNEVTLTRGSYFAEIDAFDVYRNPPKEHPTILLTEPGEPPAGSTRYEAEDGVLHRAVAGPNASASNGAKVGGMDFDDSSITTRVWADKPGRATLGIRFANGSERGGYTLEATDSLTINGRSAGTLVFPHTTWNNWHTLEHSVVLKRGWNTVVVTRLSFYAEIDAIDVTR